MATRDEAKQALLDAIANVAEAAIDAGAMAETYGNAANQLAEAYAWLSNVAHARS